MTQGCEYTIPHESFFVHGDSRQVVGFLHSQIRTEASVAIGRINEITFTDYAVPLPSLPGAIEHIAVIARMGDYDLQLLAAVGHNTVHPSGNFLMSPGDIVLNPGRLTWDGYSVEPENGWYRERTANGYRWKRFPSQVTWEDYSDTIISPGVPIDEYTRELIYGAAHALQQSDELMLAVAWEAAEQQSKDRGPGGGDEERIDFAELFIPKKVNPQVRGARY